MQAGWRAGGASPARRLVRRFEENFSPLGGANFPNFPNETQPFLNGPLFDIVDRMNRAAPFPGRSGDAGCRCED
jgi:hypothetical protein